MHRRAPSPDEPPARSSARAAQPAAPAQGVMLSESLVSSDPGWTVPRTAAASAASAPQREPLPRAARRPCCSLLLAVVGLTVQQAGLWSLYSDLATLCGIAGVVLVCLASLDVEIGLARRHGCGRAGRGYTEDSSARTRSQLILTAARILGVLAFLLLTWRGAVLSAAWCPRSDYIPSPGNTTTTVAAATTSVLDRWDYPTVVGVVCHTTVCVGPRDHVSVGMVAFRRIALPAVGERFFRSVYACRRLIDLSLIAGVCWFLHRGCSRCLAGCVNSA